MKDKRVYKQPTITIIHIESSTFITAGSNSETNHSGMNKDNRNIELGTQIEEGSASGAHAKPFEWEEE